MADPAVTDLVDRLMDMEEPKADPPDQVLAPCHPASWPLMAGNRVGLPGRD